jgi:hypothetical protein
MAQQPERGLTAHYFLNFSVVADQSVAGKGPPRRGFSGTWSKLTHLSQTTQHTVLHIDVGNSSITTLEHEKETPVAQVKKATL